MVNTHSTSDQKGEERDVRICGDFKVTINPALHAVQYPLPCIEDVFTSLSGGEHFSKIDLAQAYLQMEMDEQSKKFLTINTHKGLYQYNCLVFGIASAPALWQRVMDQVLQGIPGMQCYLDDIVTANDDADYLQNLQWVLTKLKMLNAPHPQNVSQLQSYIGLVNYYHKFLPNLSTVLHPLIAFLQTRT